jgi:hypothetical protein
MSRAEDRQSRIPPPVGQAVGTDTWNHDRRYAVYSGTTLLGTSNLEFPVEPHTRVAGRFLPTPASGHITAVFQLYGRAVASEDRRMMRRYVAERDWLRLELWDAGVRLEAAIDLISTWDDGTHIIHVTSTDSRLWRPRLLPD